MKRRTLSEPDRLAWANYVRHVAPRAGAGAAMLAAPATAAPAAEPVALPALAPAPPTPKLRQTLERFESVIQTSGDSASGHHALMSIEVGAAPASVDRATWNRLRGGKLVPARTLDLHGHTLQRAHAALHAFVGRAVVDRVRCVEVITGRGSGDSGGAIRREVPLWLNAPALRPLILAASYPHAANQGAIRLLLRRIR